MDIKKVNDNTIRVTLKPDDLNERGITVLDLLGHNTDVENFFYSILDEVDENHEFFDTGAVTFQIMPNKEGLDLFITRTNPDDTKKFNDMVDNPDDNPDMENQFTEQLVNHLTQGANDLRKTQVSEDEDDDKKYDDYMPESEDDLMVERSIFFEDIRDAISSIFLFGEYLPGTIYDYEGYYYMVLEFERTSFTRGQIADVMSVFYEYGNEATITPAQLKERACALYSGDLFEWVKTYFSKLK